jgi:hypothetical protein
MSTSSILNELTVPKTHAFRNSIYFYITLAVSLIYIGLSRLSIIDLIQINWDAPILIDGSYRLFLGQSAHDDFSTPVGPLNFLPGALGMALLGQSILGLNIGIVVFGIALSLTFSFFLTPALGHFASYIYGISLALLIISPATLKQPGYFSYTSPYNSWAYAVISFTFLYSIICLGSGFNNTPGYQIRRQNLFVLGFATSLLLYIKFPFFIASVAITLFFIQQGSEKLANLRSFLTGCITSATLIHITLGFSLKAMMRDFEILLTSRVTDYSEFLRTIENYFALNVANLFLLATCVLVSIALLQDRRTYIAWLTVITLVVDLALQITIQQEPEVVLPTFLGFVIWSLMRQKSRAAFYVSGTTLNFLRVDAILLVGILIVSNGWNFLATSVTSGTTSSIHTSNLADLQSIYPEEIILDQQLSKLIQKNTALMVVGCNDLYSFKYGLPHSDSGLLYWHKAVTFSSKSIRENTYFAATNIFKNVDVVAASYTCPHGESAVEFSTLYRTYLDSEFKLIGAGSDIEIWTR